MSWTSGFFHSVNGDRTFTADELGELVEGLISDGVYARVGNQLAVQPNSGMTVKINTGRGMFGGKWAKNTSEYPIDIEPADITLNRYCAVCVRTDLNVYGRCSEPYVKYGALASKPDKPTMERSDLIKEYCLAYVYVPAGATEITALNIEDTRGNTELCGWVAGLVDQLDTTALFDQFKAQFLNWFNKLDDYIDDDIEVKLAADMVELKATVPVKASGMIDGLMWDSQSDGSYIQNVTIEGITEDNDVLIAPTYAHRDTYISMDCEAIAQSTDTITFKCYNPKDVNITVKAIIFNNVLDDDLDFE